MRVDNNWEDTIGKRLHDFEGDLSPQAWDNINKRIKPSRSKRMLWLPVLLFFLALPGIFYFTGTQGFKETDTDELALHSGNTGFKNPAVSNQKILLKQVLNKAQSQPSGYKIHAKNNIVSELKTQPGTASPTLSASKPTIINNPGNVINQSRNTNSIAGAITSIHPARPIRSEEKTERNKQKRPGKKPRGMHMFNAISENRHAGALAYDREKKIDREKGIKKEQSVANSNAITVLFGNEKPETASATETLNTISGILKTGTQLFENQETSTVPAETQITASYPKEPATGKTETTLKSIEMLPDTAKKQLTIALPEIAKPTAKPAKKNPAKPGKTWGIAVYGTPQYAFQRVQPNQQDEIRILKLSNKNTFDAERFGYEFGVRVSYPIRENLQFTFGFQAAQLNQLLRLTTTSNLADSAVVVQQGNTISMQVYNRRQFEQHLFRYYSGGIFTGLNLAVLEKLDLSAGLGVNWLLRTKTTHENSNLPASAFNPFLSLSLQYNLPLGANLALKAGPGLQYYLRPVQEKQAFIGIKPTTLGFSVGLLYKP